MSRIAKECNCNCGSPFLMTIGGGQAFDKYQFVATCPTAPGPNPPIVVTSLGSTSEWNYIPDGTRREICGRPIFVKMVVSSTAKGGVEIIIRGDTEDGVLLAHWLSVGIWRPNCVLKLKLIDRDETCSVIWQPYICLGPYVLGCPRTGVNAIVFTSTFPGYDGTEFFIGCAYGQQLLPTPTLVFGSFAGQLQCGEGDCCWGSFEYEITVANYCGSGDPATITARAIAAFDVPNNRITVNIQVSTDFGLGSTFTETFVGPPGVFSGTITVTNPLLPERSFDLVGFDYNMNQSGCPDTCRGPSRWFLSREECEDSGLYLYKWILFDSDCGGQCFIDSCVPAIPEEPVLPGDPIDDTAAENAGLLDLLPEDVEDIQEEELVAGGCRCQEEYEPPACCTGVSVWTINRQACGGDLYLYKWQFISSTCGGPCVDPETNCNPIPPPGLPEFPIPQDAGYDSMIGVEQEGTCGCADPYETPVCPECEDCDDVLLDKTFTISGLTGGNAYLNGTYTLSKGAGDCVFVDCCWSGSNEGSVQAQISWDAGLWSLRIDGGIADYELVADVCDDPLVLVKISDESIGDVMPATITVSGT